MRPDLLQLLHTTLDQLGVSDSNAHMIVDWISQDAHHERRTWMLRAAGMGMIGFTAGAAAGWLALWLAAC